MQPDIMQAIDSAVPPSASIIVMVGGLATLFVRDWITSRRAERRRKWESEDRTTREAALHKQRNDEVKVLLAEEAKTRAEIELLNTQRAHAILEAQMKQEIRLGDVQHKVESIERTAVSIQETVQRTHPDAPAVPDV